jgi:hypothetical protein
MPSLEDALDALCEQVKLATQLPQRLERHRTRILVTSRDNAAAWPRHAAMARGSAAYFGGQTRGVGASNVRVGSPA